MNAALLTLATSKKREKEVEAYLRKTIRRHEGLPYKFVSPGRRGVPDRVPVIPCFDPSIQFIEVKAPGKEPEDYQEREHERIRKAGGIVHIVENKEEIDDLFFLLCTNPEHNK